MNSFVGQDGTIRFHYQTYGVDEVAPFAPLPRIRPNAVIQLLALDQGRIQNHRGNWGMNTGQFDWNARDDRLAESRLWKAMWMQPGHHVILPASRIYESTSAETARRWFAVKRRDDGPMWVAGLGRIQQGAYRVEWHAAMVTVDAGPVFRPIHERPREVAVLRDWDEVKTWLAAADESALRRLLRPAQEDLLESYRVHDDVLRPKFPAEKCAEPYAVA